MWDQSYIENLNDEEISERFRVVFGREMTAEERRALFLDVTGEGTLPRRPSPKHSDSSAA